jgi:hypothetical protein
LPPLAHAGGSAEPPAKQRTGADMGEIGDMM